MSTPYSSYGVTSGQTPYASTSQGTPATSSTPTTFTSVLSSANFDQTHQSQPATPTPTPAGRGRPRGAATGTGKRARKLKGAAAVAGASSPRLSTMNSFSAPAPGSSTPNQAPNAQYPRVHWAMPSSNGLVEGSNGSEGPATGEVAPGDGNNPPPAPAMAIDPALVSAGGASSVPSTPRLDGTSSFTFSSRGLSQIPPGTARPLPDEDVEGDDELLPAMADDDYSAQLSWQSQSKDNLKVLMDNFSPGQYERFEAYRRHALPKQAVRKVVQQSLGHQVSQPVAQIIAGFSKVFVGEIVEKARSVQARRGETGPLSPDHLREAYRAYQAETGRVGAARPLRSKKLFVR